LAHVFEHDAVVGGIEGAFEVCIHDVDVFVIWILASSIVMMMEDKASWMLRC
jgi:hypothetical protein